MTNEPDKVSTVIFMTVPRVLASRAEEIAEYVGDIFDSKYFKVAINFTADQEDITAEWVNRPILVQSEEEFAMLNATFTAMDENIDDLQAELQTQIEKNDG